MPSLKVDLGRRSYPILVEAGLRERAAELLLQTVPNVTSVAILSHPHLSQRYAEPLLSGLKERGLPVHSLIVPSGERYKTLATAARLYGALAEAKMDRRSLLVTLGGGVLGDLGGFVAATYLRGISFLQMPTTLLAQVDASVGGKTGVDLPQGKNLVGAFHQPRAVWIDTETLTSLPMRELRSGLAEVIKYGIIHDDAFFEQLKEDLPRLLKRDPRTLEAAIVRSCEIKADVVGQDETEQGLRAILNFGHTVGHAIEAVTAYRRYKHGEAIAIGMVSAALIGEALGRTPPVVTRAIRELLQAAHLPTDFPSDIPLEPILESMSRDKKTLGGSLHFVLADQIGSVAIVKDVPPSVVMDALRRQTVE